MPISLPTSKYQRILKAQKVSAFFPCTSCHSWGFGKRDICFLDNIKLKISLGECSLKAALVHFLLIVQQFTSKLVAKDEPYCDLHAYGSATEL